MHPKLLQKRQLDAQKATVESLAKVEKALARLERKVDTVFKALEGSLIPSEPKKRSKR